MRLTASQVQAIKLTEEAHTGPAAQVRLFGSRLDDAAKGGDVDLHLVMAHPVDVLTIAQLASRLERALNGCKVDVCVWADGQPPLPVDRVALANGVPL